MSNLIKFELYKLARAKSLYIFLGVALVMMLVSIGAIFLMGVILKNSFDDMETGMAAVDNMLASSSANDIMLTALSYSNFTLLMSIFTAIFLCDDYTQKTIKNIYSRGFSRTQIFFAKIVAILVAMLLAYIAVLIFGFLLGLIFFGNVGEFHNPVLYLEQFLYILAFMSFVVFITFAFKKVALSIVFSIVIPSAITTILTVIDYGITLDGAVTGASESSFMASQLWFGNYEILIHAGQTTSEMLSVLIGAEVYIALFIILGWLVGRKHNI